MHVLEHEGDVRREEAPDVVLEAVRSPEVREELPAHHVLEDHVQATLVVKGAREFDDEGVVHHAEDGLLVEHVLHLFVNGSGSCLWFFQQHKLRVKAGMMNVDVVSEERGACVRAAPGALKA